MRFYLTDRVLELKNGKRIVAVKNLSLAEEYLQDHFPSYPVLPGVLMFEAMIQAAAWLQRVTTDFAQSMVVLQEARNVKYGSFFKPGTQIHAVDTKKYIRNQARKEWEDEFVDEILEDDQEHEEFE